MILAALIMTFWIRARSVSHAADQIEQQYIIWGKTSASTNFDSVSSVRERTCLARGKIMRLHFLAISPICSLHVNDSSMVTPRFLIDETREISDPRTERLMLGSRAIIWREPKITNCVLDGLSLRRFTWYHELIVSKHDSRRRFAYIMSSNFDDNIACVSSA